ncbi:MAG TPA: ATP-binding protein [Gemmataceae bacterium]|nr:ATP-binding protein [Gemmataceae bacterium]
MANHPTESVVEPNDFQPQSVAIEALDEFDEVAGEVGGAFQSPPETTGAVGYTHFDAPNSEDNTVVILLAKESMADLPSQTLVRIKSLEDKHSYLGVVVAGPFAEPDGLRADSSIVVATTVQGKIFLPRYHGRAFVEILGEEINGQMIPPRFRPRPNSPVFPLSVEETAEVLQVGGDARLGVVVGQEEIAVCIPTERKSVLPRHLGVLGTTGGGKSTTVSRLVEQLQQAGAATILIDIEGEYTEMDQPTDDPQMLTALQQRGLEPKGVGNFGVGHLVGRETSRRAELKRIRSFSLRFADLSPYVVMEILDLPEAQQERFLKAYDAVKQVLKELHIFPPRGEEHRELEVDELEEGYPCMKLEHLLDMVSAFTDWSGITREDRKKSKDDGEDDSWPIALRSADLKGHEAIIKKRILLAQAPKIQSSWRGLAGRLGRLHRLRVFDNPQAPPLEHANMIQPGKVSVIDLSDTDSPQVNNLLIADILRGIQRQQEESFRKAAEQQKKPVPVVVIIEEAHEFLSEQRIKQMPVLFQQVARIAKRGRKRWLGLVFVTQLPQHLPNEVLGLINNYIVHKIADSGVVDRLKRSISGIDKAQWSRVSGLAPGQALVSLTSMTRPLLVSIDPTPCRLQLVE